MFVCEQVYIIARVHHDQRHWTSQELELQMSVHSLEWMLNSELGFFGRAIYTLQETNNIYILDNKLTYSSRGKTISPVLSIP